MTHPNPTAQEKPLLDTLRWVSAAGVALGHIYLLVFAKTPFSLHEPLGSVLSALAGLRYFCVIVFFAISGYLVGGSVLARRNRFDLKDYFSRRAGRIYIVLVPALLLTAGLDFSARLWGASGPPYSVAWPNGVLGAEPPFASYGFSNLAAAVLSLESMIGKPMGSNGALWSLGYEWAFYFVFPILMLAVSRVTDRIGALMAAVFAVAAAALLIGRSDAAIYWTIWSAGAFTAYWAGGGAVRRGLSRVATLLAIGFLALTALSPPQLHLWLYLPAGVCMALSLVHSPGLKAGLNRHADRALADCSYSLYVTHMPVATFLCFIFVQMGLLPTTGLPLAMKGLGVAMVLATGVGVTAWVFGRVFETRTAWLTDKIRRILKGPKKVPASV